MADTDKSTTPRNWNWFQARLRTKLWTSGAFIFGLLVILGVWVGFAFPWWHASHYITEYTPNPEQVLRNLVWLFGSIFGGSLAVLGFVNAIHRTQQKDRELDANRRSVDAEIFAKSVEQLGHDEMAISLGGLYSLENLARSAQALPLDTDNQAYLNSLLETLAAYIRMRAPILPEEEQSEDDKVAADIEAAVRIISRTFGFDLREKIGIEVDLRNCYLPRLEMPPFSDLQSFNFSKSHLPYADLNTANLRKTNFEHCKLQHANLDATYLEGANFKDVIITDAFFRNAIIIDSSFEYSTLTSTNFEGAIFNNSNLFDVSVFDAYFAGTVLNEVNLSHSGTLLFSEQFNEKQLFKAIWNPQKPPTGIEGSDLPNDYKELIYRRTSEIEKTGLWLKHLEDKKKYAPLNSYTQLLESINKTLP